jgi:hypothetical protein
MKSLLILVFVLVVFFAFSGLSSAQEFGRRPEAPACSQYVIGQAIHVVENTVTFRLPHNWFLTGDFNHSTVGTCSGVQSRPEAAVFPPRVGDFARISQRETDSCLDCLATC